MTAAADEAAALIAELVAHGVREVVLAPGSRSQAAALAATALARAGDIRLHVRIDERVAGFTALGLSRESGVPAVVICTSGTAVANLLPAVQEAFHAGVPLIVLTADRPPELRGVGANQATNQPEIFAAWARMSVDAPVPGEGTWAGLGRDAVAAALGGGYGIRGVAGPAHVNLPTREPLSGPLPLGYRAAQGEIPRPPSGAPLTLARNKLTVVIAGADAGPDAELLAREGGWPLIAEIVSGARFGRLLVHGYRDLLDGDLGQRIERAVVLGHPTLSRQVTSLMQRPDIEVIAISGGGEALNLNGTTIAADGIRIMPGEEDRGWLSEWMTASAARTVDLSVAPPSTDDLLSSDPAARRRATEVELDVLRMPVTRELLVDAVWRATWPHDRVMFGSSRLVRVADAVLPGKKVTVHANRGLAGIDGTIATGIGVSLAHTGPGVTRVLLGDLAFLHDVGGLLLPDDEEKPRIQVIVGNDGGGTIFDTLEVASSAAREDFDRAFYTPQTANLEAIASGYGWAYTRASTRSALDQALTAAVTKPEVIEVPLAR